MSIGKGIGQQTGGTSYDDRDEALRIVRMIAEASHEDIETACGLEAANFVRDVRVMVGFGKSPIPVTGKQLFWLRDIKDKLIEKGIL